MADRACAWHRRPVGYDIQPDGRGFLAYLVREGDGPGEGTLYPIAAARTERALRRRAERAVRREIRTFDIEHSRPITRVIVGDEEKGGDRDTR